MTRKTLHDQYATDDARKNITRISVIAISVSNYFALKRLPGAVHDLAMVKEIFCDSPQISLYKNSFTSLQDPTVDEFKNEILNYSKGRSAHGDILIIYFSGHGVVFGTNDFGFCLADTYLNSEDKIYALSLVSFRDVVQTLSIADVYPIFIIDACFSSAPNRMDFISNSMMDDLHRFFPSSYGLLASSMVDTTSFDTALGGIFTRALHSVAMNGLKEKELKRYPFLTLDLISKPLKSKIEQEGYPLPRLYAGNELPEIPICKNKKFVPETERITKYLKTMLFYIWNNGDDREVTTTEIIKGVSSGAYGNHSKLSYQPWDLVEDGSKPKSTRLTKRGFSFVKGEISIPKMIIKDPLSGLWVPAPNGKQVFISDL